METTMTSPTFPSSQVRPLRMKLEKTQEELADMLGVSRTLVTHWEKGIRTPAGPAAILLQRLRDETKSKRQKKTA